MRSVSGGGETYLSKILWSNTERTEMQREETVWLSTSQAASQLGITTRTLYRLIDSGQLPAYRFGRVIRLKEQEVESFVERSRIAPGELEHLYADSGGQDEEL